MGALHEGHVALIKDAKEFDIPILCSIFVNPTQFNDKSDFKNYPKNLNNDIEILNELEVDFIFTPNENYIYLENQFENISSGYIGTLLEGKSRPGHFDGVLTVVKRLFELVNPKVAIFGAKDAQQLFLIKEMIKKYGEQQKNVRNNRAYESLNKEIEYQELEIELAEKQIKQLKALIEQKKEALAQTEEKLEERQNHLKHKKDELDAILAETQKEEDLLLKKSAEFEKKVEDRLATAYKRIRGSVRNGLAVVPVERGASAGSFFTIPPQVRVCCRPSHPSSLKSR